MPEVEILETEELKREDFEKQYKAYMEAQCTKEFGLNNESTLYVCKIGLAQGTVTNGVETGENFNTGNIALGVELQPGNSSTVNIVDRNIAANTATLSIIYRIIATGEELVTEFDEVRVPDGEYITTIMWSLKDPENIEQEGYPKPEIEVIIKTNIRGIMY
ncbi:hypothetical protein [Paenibacillus oryzisoli]|uniref:Uncharacterized protein n=1 Tax=Paenibacillus oryzisoli TaxID=1850517 RepID=A0A198A4N0_9BACL|nr:hypothetical protein [Paenibacillus oryzisoli]OAS15918.1 hypothetical protein A8708_09505 [Paenibacillus oryzisoli]